MRKRDRERHGRYYYPRLFSGDAESKEAAESVEKDVERSGIYSVIKYLLHRSHDDRTSNPEEEEEKVEREEEANEEAGITLRNKESRAISERWWC